MTELQIDVWLTQEEVNLILEGEGVDPYICDLILNGDQQEHLMRVILSIKELESLAAGVALDFNYPHDAETAEALDLLLDKLSCLLAAHHAGIPLNTKPETEEETLDILRQFGRAYNLSEDAIEELVNRAMSEVDLRPRNDLGGLSRAQFEELTYNSWWGPDAPIKLNHDLPLADVESADLFYNARILLHALEEWGGAPTTAKGNLNRKFTADMFERMRIPKTYKERMRRMCKVINEEDFLELFVLRFLCEERRLIRKYKKRFVLTKEGRRLLLDANAGALYALLFRSLFSDFDLAYLDRLTELPEIQDCVPYALLCLVKLTGEPYIIDERLPDILLPPGLLEAMQRDGIERNLIGSLVKSRILRPLEWIGLIKTNREAGPYYAKPVSLGKTALFDRFLSFDL